MLLSLVETNLEQSSAIRANVPACFNFKKWGDVERLLSFGEDHCEFKMDFNTGSLLRPGL